MDIHTPRILYSSEGGSRSIFCGPAGVLRNRSASLSPSLHLPALSHLNSKRYNLVFVTLTCPPVAWAAPENIQPFLN